MAPCATSRSHWKIHALKDKIHEKKEFIPFIALSETWTKSYMTDAMLDIPQYTIYRSDRIQRTRGGTSIYVHENIIVTNVERFDNKSCEAIIISIPSDKMIIASVYRPPDASLKCSNDLLTFLQTYISNKDQSWTTTVLGDFNFPNICWTNMTTIPGLSKESNDAAEGLLHFMQDNFMSQYVNIPTRRNNSGSDNILDIFLNNAPNLVNHISTEETELSDHDIVNIDLTYNLCKPHYSTPKTYDPYSFEALNFIELTLTKLTVNS